MHNFLIGNQCGKHQVSHDWVKKNFNARDGPHNLTSLILAVGNDNVVVNTLQVDTDPQDGVPAPSQRLLIQHIQDQHYSIADIEDITEEIDQAFVQAVLVNHMKIG